MNRFTPCLWFESKAEEAARFYVSLFKDSRITGITHYGKAGAAASGRPEGSVMTVTFELEGQSFLAMNAGPAYTFTPAISFIVYCRTQEEVDGFWAKLSAGGEEVECGWLKDQFGVYWQVDPTVLPEMLLDKDAAKAERAFAAMLQMKKIDIAALKRAYEEA